MQPQQYTVKSGDTLSGIAAKYGISDYNVIAKANGIANPNVIRAGATLNIPGSGQAPVAPTATSAAPAPAPTPINNPAPTNSAQPSPTSGGFGAWLQSHGYNDPNVIANAVANPSSAGSAYQDYLRESGSMKGSMPGAPAPIDLVSITNSAYGTPEIKAAEQAITDREAALATATANENDNPFYSEATRVGKVAKLEQSANNDITVRQNELARLQADAAIKVNAAKGQYDINNQQYQNTLNQFKLLLDAGGLTNASPQDLATIAAQTGISVSQLQSIQKTQQDKNISTTLVTSNSGVVSVINSQTGDIISQTQPGVGPVAKVTGGSSSKVPDTNKYLTKATSYLAAADIAATGKGTSDKLLSRDEQQQAFNQILALVGGDNDLATEVFQQAFDAGGFGNYGN